MAVASLQSRWQQAQAESKSHAQGQEQVISGCSLKVQSAERQHIELA
jgi:hypothetical protein